MYAAGVITVLGAFLVFVGGLFYLISRQLPSSQGLDALAAGGVMLGIAFALQLLFPSRELNPALLSNHTAAATAVVCFLAGLQRFLDMRSLRWTEILALAMVYTILQLVVEGLWGTTARYIMLSLSNFSVYLVVSGSLLWGSRDRARDVRLGLWTLALCAIGVGVLNASRAYLLWVHGMSAINMETGFQRMFYTVVAVAVVVMGPAVLWMVFQRLSGQLKVQATTDPLTGVLNRSGMAESLERALRVRRDSEATLLMLDLDHFKRINDTHGHLAGDATLRQLGKLLQENVRRSDFVARVGGEEFVIICADTDGPTAVALAERLRHMVAKHEWQRTATGIPMSCTVSIGVSQPFDRVDELDRALREADRAMYHSKQTGRNRVVAASDLPTEEPAS